MNEDYKSVIDTINEMMDQSYGEQTLPIETAPAAQKALSLTGRLIDAFGPRPAGSDSARATADALKDEAGQFADDVWSEDFTVHPGAFLGWIRLLVIIYIAL